MKKIIYIIALAVSVSTAFGQKVENKIKKDDKAPVAKTASPAKEIKTPDEKAEKITAKMKVVLTLTDEQVVKVKQMAIVRVSSISAAKAKTMEDKNAFNVERKAIFQTWDTSLKGILTPEQTAKYQAYKEERKQARDSGKEKPLDDTNGEEEISE